MFWYVRMKVANLCISKFPNLRSPGSGHVHDNNAILNDAH